MKLQKPKLPKLTASFAVVFSVALLTICWRDAPSDAAVVVLGVLVLFCLLLAVFDASLIKKLSINVKDGEISVIIAPPEQVDETLKASAEQDKLDGKDDGEAAPSLTPLVEEAKHKESAERTDADYLTLATNAWRAENTDDALRFAYAGLERPPSDKRITAALYSRLGTIEDDLKLPEQAERHCRRAIEIDSGFTGAHNNLGLLLSPDRPEEAEVAYREAIRLDPEIAVTHYNLGILLAKGDRLEEAEAAYHDAIRLDPEFAAPRYNLGYLLSKTDRLKEAEAAYRATLRLDPTFADAQHNLDLLLEEMKK